MKKIFYVATTNAGKLRDFAIAAEAHNLSIASLTNLHQIAAPAEDESTFEGNASQKALYYSAFSQGAVVLADDSGLEVDALNGQPGVRSARYANDAAFAGPQSDTSTDDRNNLYLLDQLQSIPTEDRTARYRCALAAARNGVILALASGSVEGTILTSPRGSGGFGYDPLFFHPELGKTMAELDLDKKHELSHRGRAFRALLSALERNHPETLYD
jgi:XTP/dITP diphosphohydrolase